jgi:hypothetical protein
VERCNNILREKGGSVLSFEKLLGSDIDSWQFKSVLESMGQWPTDDDVAKVTASGSSTIAIPACSARGLVV